MVEESSTQILEIDGIPLSKEEVGELHMRGRSVMRGYYRAPELTAKVIDNEGWFNTGARLDGDCLYIVGRAKEMIIRSGFNVYPAEVEAVLSSHKDSCSPPWLAGPQMAMAGSQATPQDVMSFMRSQLTSYKRQSKHHPRWVAGDFHRQNTQTQARRGPVRGSAAGAGRSTSQTTDLT